MTISPILNKIALLIFLKRLFNGFCLFCFSLAGKKHDAGMSADSAGAPNGSVPHNICSTEKILLAGNGGFGCSPGKLSLKSTIKNLSNVSKTLAGGILSL